VTLVLLLLAVVALIYGVVTLANGTLLTGLVLVAVGILLAAFARGGGRLGRF
jgi:hypothetical protein